MRTLTDHLVNGLNEAIKIAVTDEPGPGGANHDYRIALVTEEIQQGFDASPSKEIVTLIHFQKGAIGEAGFNGITNEALLAVVIDRMRGFQSGEFKCRENACALTHLEEGMMWLQKRTRDRIARGVEGTHSK